MDNNKPYKISDERSVVNEPDEFMKSFHSQEEAELYAIKKRLQRTDMERLQMLCRMIKVGKMLSDNTKSAL